MANVEILDDWNKFIKKKGGEGSSLAPSRVNGD